MPFSYEHITYVLDAYLYTKRMKLFETNKTHVKTCEPQNTPFDSTFYGSILNLLKENQLSKFRQHIEQNKYIANNPSVWLDKTGSHMISRFGYSSFYTYD